MADPVGRDMTGSPPVHDFRPDSHSVPTLLPVKLIEDPRGLLGIVEGPRNTGFEFRRFYFLTELPEAAERGGHAHKHLWQCMISLRGQTDVALEGPGGVFEFRLDTPGTALIIPPGYWRVLGGLGPETLIGVLASDYYEESDYVRDYDVFKQTLGQLEDTSVPYLDLKRSAAATRSLVADALIEAVAAGRYIGGPLVDAFEASFSAYCGTTATVGVANGLHALELALRANGIEEGDEVLIPAHTFVATAMAVTNVGGIAVPVDIEPDTGLLDATTLETSASSRTRAIIPVHLYGHPVDMDAVLDVARRHGWFVLEDAAQAHGARYKGRVCGSLGDAAAFSFYPTKNLGALGDAGAVTTSNREIAAAVRTLGNYGAAERYHHDVIGTNSRLDTIQAAVLLKKLSLLEEWNEKRRTIAGRYLSELQGIPDLVLPVVRPWATPVWHVFQVRVPLGLREPFRNALAEQGVGTNVHYPVPVHLQTCYGSRGWGPGDFPEAEDYCSRTVSLPLDPFTRPSEIEKVLGAIRGFFGAQA